MIQNSKKYAGIVLLAMILLSSCATFLNSRLQKIHINTPKNVKIISVDRSILVDSLVKRKRERKTYFVQRSKLPIKVIVQVDSTQKTILLKPKYMFASWANFCFNNGLSMLVDTNNKRCYRYQISNYIREYKRVTSK